MLTYTNLVVVFLALLTSPTFAGTLNLPLFQDIQAISKTIQATCPPATCVVIGMGSSPTPFIAYLQTENKNYAWNVPLSEFRAKLDNKSMGLSSPALDSRQENKLFDHFETFFPSKDELGTRSILIVDYTSTGSSLFSGQQYFNKYFKSGRKNLNPVPPKIETLGLSSNPLLANTLPAQINYVISLPEKTPIATALSTQHFFRDVSEFGSFDLRYDGPKQKLGRGEYAQFKKEIENFKNEHPLKSSLSLKDPELFKARSNSFNTNAFSPGVPLEEKLRVLNNSLS